MASILDTVDERTQLVGQNRMELLMFRLTLKQRFGINVFKVREVTQCPRLTVIPSSHPVVRGIADFRGKAIPVIDLGMAVGCPPLEKPENSFAIITEYNRAVQALLVRQVDRIVNLHWNEIIAPPAGTGGSRGSYLTAVTEINKELVEIIDVEKVMAEVVPTNATLSADIDRNAEMSDEQIVVVVDDSSVARSQICRTLEELGIKYIAAHNGRKALELLKGMAAKTDDITKQVLMVISDVEMPEMDGYTLCTEVRFDDKLKGLYIVLHTSLSGVFNKALIEKVGANSFIAKFQPDILAKAIHDRIRDWKQAKQQL
jgi:two-component system chemotaxis response regulator CheV